MSVSQILTTYDGQEPTLCITGGGGGGVVSVGVGAGLTLTGTPTVNPTVNLGFTNTNQLLYGTGLNTGSLLGPGAPGDFLRINNAITPALEWHPISAGGVVSVSANPGGACFVNNSNSSTPAVAIAFPAGDKGALPASDGTGVNLGQFLAGPLADGSQQNYVLSADNMSAVGFSWKAAAGTAITGEAPLVEFIDGTLTKVGINFGVGAAGIGQIPVGISSLGGKEGVLTPALVAADDGKVLTASSADAATGGVKWDYPDLTNLTVGAGLTKTGTSTAPIVNLGFVDKGDILSGTGLNAGFKTPIGTAGQVLAVVDANTGGIGWIDAGGGGGGSTIIRSSAPTTAIALPSTANDTLVLIAEEPNESWDPVATQFFPPNTTTIEFIVSNVAENKVYAGYALSRNNQRCVVLYNITTPGSEAYIGTFTQEEDPYTTYPASITCATNGVYAGQPTTFTDTLTDCIILSGRFNQFENTAQAYLPLWNIVKLNTTNDTVSQVSTPQPLGSNQIGLTYASPGYVSNNVQGVFKIIPKPTGGVPTSTPNGFWAFGSFTQILIDGGNAPTTNYANIIYFDAVAGSYVSAATMAADGLGLYLNTEDSGAIHDVYWDPTIYTAAGELRLWIAGNFNEGWTFSAGAPVPLPPGNTGFAIYDNIGTTYAFERTPASPVFPLITGYSIALSTQVADTYIIGGDNCIITLNDSAFPILTFTEHANPTTAPNPPLPRFNAITSGSVELTNGGGLVACDFVLMTELTPANTAPPTYVAYFTTATGAVPQMLAPQPTGFSADNAWEDNTLSSYGIRVLGGNELVAAGLNALYEFKTGNHVDIIFTLAGTGGTGFKQGAAITTSAKFAAPAFQSQSYCSSADKRFWIQTGAAAPGLTYI